MMSLRRLAADRAGSSAAEMVMVMPLLLFMMFGTFELGNYFLSEHVVQKAVRDASRYASRLPMSSYPACIPSADAEEDIQQIARTGDPDGTDERLAGWTDNSMTDVELTCYPIGTYRGIYADFADGVPVITVTATVPYSSLFATMGLGSPSLTLRAASEAAVFGA